jgi:malate dehydrogenase (oxaloacetate-decarboxylating)(NADP+)
MHPPLHLQAIPTSATLLQSPLLNKGMAFTPEERSWLGLRGLIPPAISDIAAQADRVLLNLDRQGDDLDRYIYLSALQDRNETLFYRVLVDHVERMMPLVYTPTVGRACQEYGHIYRRPRGLFLSLDDVDALDECVANWPHQDVRVIVVTDGERILGLGDLGAHGMGIPVGKLSLYTALAGIHPAACLPVTLDVGTDNQALLEDPLYIGLRRRRERGPGYDRLVDGFIAAALRRWPNALIQFEDFGNRNAFRVLARWRDRICCFNDDIQGTAAVTLAGLLGALRITGQPLAAQRLLIVGAGEAGLGIAHLVAERLRQDGAEASTIRSVCWFVDSKGLIVEGRADLSHDKQAVAQPGPGAATVAEAVERVRPTALIGVSGQGGSFTRQILERMGALQTRPIVFALSNPTSRAECSAAEADAATGGRAIFASGSPFPPLLRDGRLVTPSQCNNAYVFPGVGLGSIACGARRIGPATMLAAADALARMTTATDAALGRVLPPLSDLRRVSAQVAAAVAASAWDAGLADQPRPADPAALVASHMWDPVYPSYGPGASAG